MLVLSAGVLPAYNLMLDIPALAVGSAALVLLMRATQTDRLIWALLAGALFAVAIESKFTGGALLGAGLLYATIQRRWDLALAAGMVCGMLCYWWEWRMHDQYGASHLVWNFLRGDVERWPKLWLVVPLMSLVGSVAPGLTWLAATASRWPRWSVALLILAQVVLALGLLWGLDPRAFALPGALALATLAWATYELLQSDRLARVTLSSVEAGAPAGDTSRRDHWFLAAWLVMELVAYFILTPFPATRRVLGITLAGSLLAGAVLRWRGTPARTVWWLTAFSVVWGVAIAGLDLREAWAQREALETAARQSLAPADSEGRWFIGHWGWQFYAEQLGWKPLIPDRSELKEGDFVLMADGIDGPLMGPPAGSLDDYYETLAEVVIDDPIGWRTIPTYYHGVAALEAKQGPRVTAKALRVRKAHVPVTTMDARTLAFWALLRPGPRAANAAPALVAALRRTGDKQEVALLAVALLKASPPALVAALGDGDDRTRRGALRAFATLGPRAASLVPDLKSQLGRPEEDICVAAIAALGAIGPPAAEVLPELERLSHDERTAVRDNARVASEMILGRLPRGNAESVQGQ